MNWKSGMNRREFLWTVGSLSAMAAVGGVTLGFDPKQALARPGNAALSAAWLPKGETSYELFKSMIEKSTDFSWLKRGDSVLVKLALNSGNPYPATSDPWALDCLLKVLNEHGAGKVYVGDQSGVRNVYWTAEGQQRGSSRAFCQATGLLPVIEENGATPVFFEERGYDAYIETYPTGKHHWPEPLRITSFVNEVDHIVYLPRVGSHGLADVTSGLKIGVGFLREDSRRVLHRGGENFYPMYQEIGEVPEVKSKIRLCVSSGRQVMSLVGPDAGYITEAYGGPVFASENLLAHELFAYAWVQYHREYLTPKDAYDPSMGNLWDVMKMRAVRNKGFVKLVWQVPENEIADIPLFQPGDIYKHPAIKNYIRLNNQADVQFTVVEINENPDHIAKQYLQRLLKL